MVRRCPYAGEDGILHIFDALPTTTTTKEIIMALTMCVIAFGIIAIGLHFNLFDFYERY